VINQADFFLWGTYQLVINLFFPLQVILQ
jgi:hypothetical protein